MTNVHANWPPLILASRRPIWLRIRDTILTTAAWFTLAILLSREIEFGLSSLLRSWGWGAMVDRLRLADLESTLGWAEFARHLTPYLLILMMLLMFLCTFGIHTRLRRRRSLKDPSPLPLTLALEAMTAGVTYTLASADNDDTVERGNEIVSNAGLTMLPTQDQAALLHARSLRTATIEVTPEARYRIAEADSQVL